MDAYQGRVVESFRRVQGWFAANKQYVADNPSLGAQVETLNGIVSRLTDHVTAQDTQGAQSLLVSRDELEQRRELVSHHMAPIAKVARALRGMVPGIGVLSMPKWNVSPSEVIAAAKGMAEKAEIYKEPLLESGLPADFIEQLQAAAAALEASLNARGLARASRVAATQGVATELAQGRRLVSILDAVVARLLHAEPVKLAEWEQLKRVTVKAVFVRGGQSPTESGKTPGQPPSTNVESSSEAVVKVA